MNVEADFIKEALDAGLYKQTTRITSSILLQTSDIVHRTMAFLHTHKHINKKLMNNTKYKKLEDALLNATDLLIEKAKSQGEKALYNLFKSAILKKYRDQYDVDIQQGEVEKDTVDKSIDFLFENACVSFRTLPNIKDSDKENVIRQAQAALPSWKVMVIQNLTNKGIKVV